MVDYLIMRLLRKFPILGPVFVVTGLLLLPIGAIMMHNFYQLRQSPATTTGTVESLPGDTREGGKLQYHYTVAGKTYENSVSVGTNEISDIQAGTPLVVHYDSQNPASSVTEGSSPNMAFAFIISGVMCLLFPVFAKLGRRRELRRQRRQARI